jgi:hypothetical protein
MKYNFILLAFILASCHSAHPSKTFEAYPLPPTPDYTDLAQWAAHPGKTDLADRTPCPDIRDEQSSAAVDVFFLYPTTYTGAKRSQSTWNAAVLDEVTNIKTDEGTILFQASIFNGTGKIYAPRYRQAHLHAFFTRDKASAKKALDIAYSDVKTAFEYYLKYWNQGRPFIIAGHSQGALHAMHLIKDLVENQPIQKQFIGAYIVGWPVTADFFSNIPACTTPEQTGCFCSWRSWERQSGLKLFTDNSRNIVCTNPLSWRIEEGNYMPATANKGGVVRPFCAVYPQLTDAEIHQGYILCKKPRFPGSAFIRAHNYHPGDLNLYYMNVRENAQLRARTFLSH